MVSVTEQASSGPEVLELESIGDLGQLRALAEGVKTRRVARGAFGSGRQGGNDAAVAGEGYLVEPPEACAVLLGDSAVLVEEKQVWVARRGDGAHGQKAAVLARPQTGDPLPGKLTQTPRVPARHAALGGRRTDVDNRRRSMQHRTRRQKQQTCRASQ